jgi:hypothetical protein
MDSSKRKRASRTFAAPVIEREIRPAARSRKGPAKHLLTAVTLTENAGLAASAAREGSDVMQNSYRMSIRNASTLSAIGAESVGDDARLPFGACFMLWMGLIGSSWAAIAFVLSLL